jgi:integrase
MSGNITRRGKASWRLKFQADDPATGQRIPKYVTVHGTYQSAQKELTRLLSARDGGALVDPTVMTTGAWFTQWLADPPGLAPRSVERYRQIAVNQIEPTLGAIPLQKLAPFHVDQWLATLRQSGHAPSTIVGCHRTLRQGLKRAVKLRVIAHNVADEVDQPRAAKRKIAVPTVEEVVRLREGLRGHELEPIATLALTTGARRNELLALHWSHIDFDRGTLTIEGSLEQTKGRKLRVKGPKTAAGVRALTLPADMLALLRTHKVRQLEAR